LSTAALRVLPNYLVTYIPIAAVMIINPLLYIFSSKEIDKQLIARLSQITTTEREIMNKFKMKFAIITTVFYVCWLPNLINGVILWSAWVKLPVKFVVFNWYVMVSWYDYTFDVDFAAAIFVFFFLCQGDYKSAASVFQCFGLPEMGFRL
jgi:hypothetical protein